MKNNNKNIYCRYFLSCLLFVFVNNIYAVEEVNTNAQGIMLGGYDPVSYFQEGIPLKGTEDFQFNYQQGIYYFATLGNREKFINNPQQYIPAYGGYCAYGVRMGQKLQIDPHAWKVVDGTLYFQLNQGTRTIWNKDLQENIEIADRIWPQIRSQPIPE